MSGAPWSNGALLSTGLIPMIEMGQAFIGGLLQVFSGTTFTLMMLGILIGFAVGILPGLGGPVTLALMLPFIFKMEAVEAFAFLLGMAAVTATTGDITSILFGIPVWTAIPWPKRARRGAPWGQP